MHIAAKHNGDITTITVVYDRGADLLTRVTYSIHGVALEGFRLASPESISFRLLRGKDQNNAYLAIAVVVLSLSDADQYQQGDHHSPSDSYVYLARDPVSLHYEHPVVFAEYGAHELWPNSSGSVTTAPAHNGDGFSFLPDTVQILGTLDQPNAGYEPFLYYNGKFGTDPQAIILHRTWFWPDGRGRTKGRDQNHPAVIPTDVPGSRFTDQDPYVSNGGLDWPPRLENANGPVTVYVDHVAVYSNYVTGTTFNGSASSPFPDPMTANSFVRKGGVVAVAAGTYPGGAVLSRGCKLVSRGGTVTIGGP
jgi:hypothetical protein